MIIGQWEVIRIPRKRVQKMKRKKRVLVPNPGKSLCLKDKDEGPSGGGKEHRNKRQSERPVFQREEDVPSKALQKRIGWIKIQLVFDN